MYDIYEIRERIQGMYADPNSEEGQAEIHSDEGAHVVEVWQDGEVTSTKKRDLYRQRSLHQRDEPFLPTGRLLFPKKAFKDEAEWLETYRGQRNKRMVVVDRRLLDILDEYRDFVVDKEVIDAHQ